MKSIFWFINKSIKWKILITIMKLKPFLKMNIPGFTLLKTQIIYIYNLYFKKPEFCLITLL